VIHSESDQKLTHAKNKLVAQWYFDSSYRNTCLFVPYIYLCLFLFYFLLNLHVSGYLHIHFHSLCDNSKYIQSGSIDWHTMHFFTAHHSVQWCTRLSLIIMYLTYIIHAPLCNAVGITVWKARPKV